jgi:hypothetical protein
MKEKQKPKAVGAQRARAQPKVISGKHSPYPFGFAFLIAFSKSVKSA